MAKCRRGAAISRTRVGRSEDVFVAKLAPRRARSEPVRSSRSASNVRRRR